MVGKKWFGGPKVACENLDFTRPEISAT